MAQASSTTTNTEMPFTATLTDCNGQPVVVAGTMHMVTHFTVSSNGGTHVHINTNWQDVSGTSGTTTYQAHSNNHFNFNSNGSQSELTTIDDVRLISAGPSDNLKIRAHMHITINANGEPTASFTMFEVVCTG
ncbi:MAG TPA: hypothetical protein VM911_04980 [Pyrinomonadaceae bacterium]|nr:hypothetical protein [Pyrinomonadaceae bacterium]